jgi:hypothetical protein
LPTKPALVTLGDAAEGVGRMGSQRRRAGCSKEGKAWAQAPAWDAATRPGKRPGSPRSWVPCRRQAFGAAGGCTQHPSWALLPHLYVRAVAIVLASKEVSALTLAKTPAIAR